MTGTGAPARRAAAVIPMASAWISVPCEQHALAPVPVAEQGGERGEDGGRDELHHPDSPGGRGPAAS